MLADDLMRNVVLFEVNGHEVFLGCLSGLLDGVRDLIGLAEAEANLALLIASYH
jgi:hypothetical protein